eukprot:m.57907 g.57907  ORF g.57907 m.57907 type:complete len:259 (+) comp9380_c0_seq3:57-833(+)
MHQLFVLVAVLTGASAQITCFDSGNWSSSHPSSSSACASADNACFTEEATAPATLVATAKIDAGCEGRFSSICATLASNLNLAASVSPFCVDGIADSTVMGYTALSNVCCCRGSNNCNSAMATMRTAAGAHVYTAAQAGVSASFVTYGGTCDDQTPAVSSVESCATNCISACGSLVAANIVSCVGKYSTNSFLKSKTCDCTSCTDGVSTYSQCTNQLCDQSDNTSLIIVAVVCAVVCLVCCVGCCIFCKKKSTPTSIA